MKVNEVPFLERNTEKKMLNDTLNSFDKLRRGWVVIFERFSG